MNTGALMTLDLLVGFVAAATWLSAGAAAATGRTGAARVLAAAGMLATVCRVWTVLALAGAGWWFAQEKLTLTLPLAVVTAVAAVILAGPGLLRRGGAAAAGQPRVVVPLLTSGYAAAVGLILTLFAGYPATVPSAVVTVALVAAAALVTVRVMVPSSGRRVGLAVAVTLGLSLVGWGLAYLGTGTSPAAAAGTTSVLALRGPDTPDPGGTVRRYTLTARRATLTLPSGQKVAAWTFNGQVPGPALTATQGDLVEVRLRNADVAQGVTLHWHGYDVPAGEDGVPGLTQAAVAPGQEFVYRFRAEQAGTYWYHTHEVSDVGVRMGLYGTLVVQPRMAVAGGLDLALPVHTLASRTLLGDRDELATRQVAPGTAVRLRLVNTDSTPHRFTLAGVAYRLVAVDGTDLSGPGELTRVALRLAAGGRYDVAFTMPSAGVALLVDGDRTGGLRLAPPGSAQATVDGTGGWPELDLTRYGTPAAQPWHADTRFDRDYTLVLDQGLTVRGGVPRFEYTVNGRAFPAIPTMVVREGDVVRMTIVNRGRVTHPWHLHGHRVLVLARDGHAVTGSPLWMDTFDVRPGEVWQVAFRADNPGVWMNHCHNLSHAAQGMLLHLAYEGVSSPLHEGH
jgi:FtsP/CotA-like multicopper oxidase with cupredoxin domain